MISIIDYKMGNIRSVQNALSFLGIEYQIINSEDQILNSEKIILPGVGSFSQAMKNIKEMNLYNPIREAALNRKIPILGICLGMQLLADYGEEDGYSEGLGLIAGKVSKLNITDESLKIPHVGFNSTYYKEDNILFTGLDNPTDFYYVHSYQFVVENEENISSFSVYGEKFTSSVQNNNIFGTQFHPEKSQANGLILINNFITLGSKMVKDRLIFSLLMQNGTYMLGRNFKLQRVGDLQWIQDNYDVDSILYSIDELIVVNVDREEKSMKSFTTHLAELTKHCFMPVAAGGGISSVQDAYAILNAGADKIIINSILVRNKQLVKDLVKIFGSQCIVASIDYKKEEETIRTFINNGTVDSKLDLYEAVDNAIELGAGEIYLNSIAREGTGQGLDIEIVRKVSKKSKIPVIAAGGIERTDQFYEGIKNGEVQAVAASDLLYFMGDSLSKARDNMSANGCNMAKWGNPSEFIKLQH